MSCDLSSLEATSSASVGFTKLSEESRAGKLSRRRQERSEMRAATALVEQATLPTPPRTPESPDKKLRAVDEEE